MASITKKTGAVLPVVTLFQSPTVELLAAELAARIEDQKLGGVRIEDQKCVPLVQMQAGNGELPFFCVHPGGGSVMCYAELLACLGADQPFYGFQSLGLQGEQTPLHKIEEMASHYIEAMMTVQPNGPYLIGGWSLGGVIAFEMARQLESQGEQIALLALFDASLPSTRAQDDDASLLFSFAYDLGLAANDLETINELRREESLAYVLEQAKKTGRLPAEFDLPGIQNLWRVFASNVRAWRLYVARRYSGPLLFFKASEAINGRDASLAWKELTDRVEERVVPGNHFNMLKPPQVHVLAEELKRYIRKSNTRRQT